jgi:hypothetical protein
MNKINAVFAALLTNEFRLQGGTTWSLYKNMSNADMFVFRDWCRGATLPKRSSYLELVESVPAVAGLLEYQGRTRNPVLTSRAHHLYSLLKKKQVAAPLLLETMPQGQRLPKEMPAGVKIEESSSDLNVPARVEPASTSPQRMLMLGVALSNLAKAPNADIVLDVLNAASEAGLRISDVLTIMRSSVRVGGGK